MRGISEYMATVIMIIITLIAGLTMFLYVNNVVDIYYNSLSARLTSIGRDSIDVMASYIANNTIIVVISVGMHSIKMYSIYVNDTLYTSCKIYIGDKSIVEIDGGQGVEIPYLSIAIVKCPANSSNICDIKIVYSGGEIYAKASKIM